MRPTSEFLVLVQLLTALQASPLLSPEEKLAVAGAAVAEFNGRVNPPVYETAATNMLAALSAPALVHTPAPEEAAPAPSKRAAGTKAKAAP